MNRNPGSKPNSKPSSKPKQKLTNNPKPTSATQQPPPSKPSEPEPEPPTTTSTLSSLTPSIPNDPSSLLPILTPAFEILSRFHHRNKNQHRLSKWWAEADMLRRHLRKLIEAANEWCDKEPERETKKRKEELRRKKREKNERLGRVDKLGENDEEGNGGEEEEDREMEEVKLRAEYLRGTLRPRAYFAFGQLTADRQFAHLGLMLLGVLAQVDKALSAFASIPIENGDGSVADQAAEDGSTAVNATGDAPKQRHNDTGVAVSREELSAMMSASGSETAVSRNARDEPLPTTETEIGEATAAADRKDKNKGVGKKRSSDNEDTSAPEKTVKKRKTEAGDDVDGIVASFDKPKKEKKDKKPRKTDDGDEGNDIDDIFASVNKPVKKKKKTTTVATVTTTSTTTATTSIATVTATATQLEEATAPESGPEETKDDLDSIFASLEKPKKKKLKAKETDDLDDIFAAFDKPSSNTSKKKKKKKKTGAGADEFDDIFGGL